MRVWDMGGSTTGELDYSKTKEEGSSNGDNQSLETKIDPVCTPSPLRSLRGF